MSETENNNVTVESAMPVIRRAILGYCLSTQGNIVTVTTQRIITHLMNEDPPVDIAPHIVSKCLAKASDEMGLERIDKKPNVNYIIRRPNKNYFNMGKRFQTQCKHKSLREVGKEVGLSHTTIWRYVTICERLSPQVISVLSHTVDRIGIEKLSTLASVSNPVEQLNVARRLVEEGLTNTQIRLLAHPRPATND